MYREIFQWYYFILNINVSFLINELCSYYLTILRSLILYKKCNKRCTYSNIMGKFSLTLYDAFENYANCFFYRCYILNLSLSLAIYILDKALALRNFCRIYFLFSFPVYSILQQNCYSSSVDWYNFEMSVLELASIRPDKCRIARARFSS